MKPIYWYTHIVFNNAKSHCIPNYLRSQIVADLVCRPGGVPVSIKEQSSTRYHFIDLGGMCCTNEPLEVFRLPGLTVKVMSSHVEALAEQLKSLQPRTLVSGMAYYKIHGRWRCLVLSPDDFKNFLKNVQKRVPKASKRSKTFFDTHFPIDKSVIGAVS